MSDPSERPDPSPPSANAEGEAVPPPAPSEGAEAAASEEAPPAETETPAAEAKPAEAPAPDAPPAAEAAEEQPLPSEEPASEDLRAAATAESPADPSAAPASETSKQSAGDDLVVDETDLIESPEDPVSKAVDSIVNKPAAALPAGAAAAGAAAAGAAAAGAAAAPAAAAPAAPAGALPTPAGAAPEEGLKEPEEEGFLQGLWKTKITLLCVALIVGAFVLQIRATPGKWNHMWPFSDSVYLAHGGYLYSAIRESNEWWRFITGVFVAEHGLSALVGVYLLFQMGGSMERILGSARTIPLIVLSGVGGLAIADLWFPARPASGPFVVGFALMGALPGVILGVTGSIKRTAQVPAARSAAFFSVLWIGVYWFISAQFNMPMNFAGLIGGVLSAFVVGFALGLSRRDLTAGLVALVLATGAIAFPVVMVCQGKRYEEGKLVPRGVPAGSSTPRPEGPSKEATAKLAKNAREKAEVVLDRFGKLPYYPETGEQGLDNDQAAEVGAVLTELTELADGTSMVTVQVDDLRARAHVLLGQGHAAKEIAYLLVGSAPTPWNRALYGVTLYASTEYEKALDVFGKLLQVTGTDTRMPEVHYYKATTLFQLGRDEEAQQSFGAYLSLVSSKPLPEWRERFVARAKRELGR